MSIEKAREYFDQATKSSLSHPDRVIFTAAVGEIIDHLEGAAPSAGADLQNTLQGPDDEQEKADSLVAEYRDGVVRMARRAVAFGSKLLPELNQALLMYDRAVDESGDTVEESLEDRESVTQGEGIGLGYMSVAPAPDAGANVALDDRSPVNYADGTAQQRIVQDAGMCGYLMTDAPFGPPTRICILDPNDGHSHSSESGAVLDVGAGAWWEQLTVEVTKALREAGEWTWDAGKLKCHVHPRTLAEVAVVEFREASAGPFHDLVAAPGGTDDGAPGGTDDGPFTGPEEPVYRERPIEEDFYLDPNGKWVYKWSEERRVLVGGVSRADCTICGEGPTEPVAGMRLCDMHAEDFARWVSERFKPAASASADAEEDQAYQQGIDDALAPAGIDLLNEVGRRHREGRF